MLARLTSELSSLRTQLTTLRDEEDGSRLNEQLIEGRRKVKQLKDNERSMVEELQRIDKEVRLRPCCNSHVTAV